MKFVAVPWQMRWDGPILALAAFLIRLGVVLFCWDLVPPSADGKFYHVVAQRIAQGDGYTWLWPDGAVTYAAHYPVGYPALMAVPYSIFGAVPGVVMVVNALLGALIVGLSHGLCLDVLKSRARPFARPGAGVVGALLAVSPTLVGYTPALMTEGAVVTFVTLAAWLVVRVRTPDGAPKVKLVLCVFAALALGGAVLLRPQSILFAPVLGFLSCAGKLRFRAVTALLFTLGCVVVVLPWTLRNCDKMERCVFVSANGGWNLLIGTFPEGQGAWVALEGGRVPPECRDVFQEAAKDTCFGAAGMRRIRDDPFRWLSLLPAKLRATLDHTAAAADHLVEAGALTAERKRWLSIPEFAFQRIEYLFALLGAWSCSRKEGSATHRTSFLGLRSWDWGAHLLLAIGAAGFLGLGATWGWLACILLFAWAKRALDAVGLGVGVFGVAITMVVHGGFFGAGRYALPIIPLVAPLAALGVAEALRLCRYASSPTRGAAKFDTRSGPE